MVVTLSSCTHLGPLEFPQPGTDLTTHEMSSAISLLMVIAKPFL
jgi:predicted small lipoprotein YifL